MLRAEDADPNEIRLGGVETNHADRNLESGFLSSRSAISPSVYFTDISLPFGDVHACISQSLIVVNILSLSTRALAVSAFSSS
jgi:hypothetical protein